MRALIVIIAAFFGIVLFCFLIDKCLGVSSANSNPVEEWMKFGEHSMRRSSVDAYRIVEIPATNIQDDKGSQIVLMIWVDGTRFNVPMKKGVDPNEIDRMITGSLVSPRPGD
jgi:hypothetical protein